MATYHRTLTCKSCGKRFQYEQQGRGAPRSTCSSKCKEELRFTRRLERLASYPECSVQWCDGRGERKVEDQPVCEMHYYRARRHGTLDGSDGHVRIANGQCHQCGVPVRRRNLFCSDMCKRRSRLGHKFGALHCVVCDVELAHGKPAHSEYCSRECVRVVARAKKYGIPIHQMYTMLQDANGCAICGDQDVELVVDHCHSTGDVRALLCGPCNVGIGMFHEDTAKLRAAAEYLQSWQSPKQLRLIG